ncbi:MAG: hypothetical protein GQ474_07735, partial [Sulfurimonas sp.]|nr:hypothetical protein [Sulfurimonas sp.]
MATIIATVKGLEGKFFAKDAVGNIIELKNGDFITQDMLVFGDKSNLASATIEIAMFDNNDKIVLTGTQEQAFDSSLIDGESYESGLASKSVKDALDEDLYADEDAIGKEDKEDLAVLDETAAGEERAKTSAAGEGQFEDRDGAQTDIVAGLRDAGFGLGGTAREPDAEEKFVLNAELSIDGMTLVREGNAATYTLSVTTAPITDLLVSVKIAHIDTDSGDIVEETIVVTVPAGSETGTFTIDNFDNNYKEPDEDYSVTIVGTEGGGYDLLTIGEDSVTTTIYDETATENPDPEDKTTVSITTADVTEDEASVKFDVALSNPPQDHTTTTVQVEVNGTTYDVAVDADGKGSFTVPTKHSDVYLDPDTITGTVAGVTGGGYEEVTTGQDATAKITDTLDDTKVTLTATPSTNEDDGSIVYTATIENKAANDVTVTLDNGVVITIEKGELSGDSTAQPVTRDNDDVSGEDKYNETDSVSAKIVSATEENAGTAGSLEKLTFDDTPAVTTIVDDNDATKVTLTGTKSTSEDDGSIVYTATISQVANNDVTVTLNVGTDGQA